MTRKERIERASKCEEIVMAIVDLANRHGEVSFECDFGGYTLTVIAGESHTHVGIPPESEVGDDAEFTIMVDNLFGALTGKGGHLSWSPEPPSPERGA